MFIKNCAFFGMSRADTAQREITANDIAEIKKLIKEEHEYLLKHQVGIS